MPVESAVMEESCQQQDKQHLAFETQGNTERRTQLVFTCPDNIITEKRLSVQTFWVSQECVQYIKEHSMYLVSALAHTLVVQLCSVLGEALQPDSLTEQIQELVQRRPGVLIIVHLLLCALTRFAIQDAHFVLETQLQHEQTHTY